MTRAVLLGLPVLALSTSCVPQDATAPLLVPRAYRPVGDSHALLRQLALATPAGLQAIPEQAAERSAPAAPIAAPPFVLGRPVDSAGEATDCLTAAVYYEARSEPVDGQRAVAQVVLNRVRDRAFPASVCGVVYQRSGQHAGCQFSFACDGSMDRPREQLAWDRARRVAVAALSGSVYAPVASATYYHAASVSPWWAPSLFRIGSVGAHVFYRWRDRMESALAFSQAYAGEEPSIAPLARSIGTSAGMASVMGVSVHYGRALAERQGVTIHQGPATGTARAVPTISFGVRVHLGETPLQAAAIAASDRSVTL